MGSKTIFKRDLIIFFFLFILTLAFFHKSLFIFFTQDDYILINAFSSQNLLKDFAASFGPPQVTHWRPLHNLYFLISGNLFGTNYALYHLLTVFMHVTSAYFVYKIMVYFLKNNFVSFLGASLYAINPSHFISIFWISGGATVIGFTLLSASFYAWIKSKNIISTILYIFSLLASEAMLAGLVMFIGYEFLIKKNWLNKKHSSLLGISLIFMIAKFLITRKDTFDSYELAFSFKQLLITFKYYLPKILGIAETSGDLISSLILILLVIFTVVSARKYIFTKIHLKSFSLILVTAGLFPFIFFPNHLSPHYMNISIFGLCFFLGTFLVSVKRKTLLFLFFSFLVIFIFNLHLTLGDNWVIKRSNISWEYVQSLKIANLTKSTNIIFVDNNISSAREAYIALGGGTVMSLLFANSEYITCFFFGGKCNSIETLPLN